MSINPYTGKYRTIQDFRKISKLTSAALDILEAEMKEDPGHDFAHIYRVAINALWFDDHADVDTVVTAALLHDLVNVPKDSPNRTIASKLSALKAIAELKRRDVLKEDALAKKIFHAIEAHSWSAGVKPETIEAMVVQDADRIDALGYVGIARLFSVGGSLGRKLFHPQDPLCYRREPNELEYTVDHYFQKLASLHLTMQTPKGREIAIERTQVMYNFIQAMIFESAGN